MSGYGPELRALVEEIVRRIVSARTPRLVWRVVTAVQAPDLSGRGGTATVVDGLGNESAGWHWYEHRPVVGDNVLCEIPPPGGTRRIVAIDREY